MPTVERDQGQRITVENYHLTGLLTELHSKSMLEQLGVMFDRLQQPLDLAEAKVLDPSLTALSHASQFRGRSKSPIFSEMLYIENVALGICQNSIPKREKLPKLPDLLSDPDPAIDSSLTSWERDLHEKYYQVAKAVRERKAKFHNLYIKPFRPAKENRTPQSIEEAKINALINLRANYPGSDPEYAAKQLKDIFDHMEPTQKKQEPKGAKKSRKATTSTKTSPPRNLLGITELNEIPIQDKIESIVNIQITGTDELSTQAREFLTGILKELESQPPDKYFSDESTLDDSIAELDAKIKEIKSKITAKIKEIKANNRYDNVAGYGPALLDTWGALTAFRMEYEYFANIAKVNNLPNTDHNEFQKTRNFSAGAAKNPSPPPPPPTSEEAAAANNVAKQTEINNLRIEYSAIKTYAQADPMYKELMYAYRTGNGKRVGITGSKVTAKTMITYGGRQASVEDHLNNLFRVRNELKKETATTKYIEELRSKFFTLANGGDDSRTDRYGQKIKVLTPRVEAMMEQYDDFRLARIIGRKPMSRTGDHDDLYPMGVDYLELSLFYEDLKRRYFPSEDTFNYDVLDEIKIDDGSGGGHMLGERNMTDYFFVKEVREAMELINFLGTIDGVKKFFPDIPEDERVEKAEELKHRIISRLGLDSVRTGGSQMIQFIVRGIPQAPETGTYEFKMLASARIGGTNLESYKSLADMYKDSQYPTPGIREAGYDLKVDGYMKGSRTKVKMNRITDDRGNSVWRPVLDDKGQPIPKEGQPEKLQLTYDVGVNDLAAAIMNTEALSEILCSTQYGIHNRYNPLETKAALRRKYNQEGIYDAFIAGSSANTAKWLAYTTFFRMGFLPDDAKLMSENLIVNGKIIDTKGNLYNFTETDRVDFATQRSIDGFMDWIGANWGIAQMAINLLVVDRVHMAYLPDDDIHRQSITYGARGLLLGPSYNNTGGKGLPTQRYLSGNALKEPVDFEKSQAELGYLIVNILAQGDAEVEEYLRQHQLDPGNVHIWDRGHEVKEEKSSQSRSQTGEGYNHYWVLGKIKLSPSSPHYKPLMEIQARAKKRATVFENCINSELIAPELMLQVSQLIQGVGIYAPKSTDPEQIVIEMKEKIKNFVKLNRLPGDYNSLRLFEHWQHYELSADDKAAFKGFDFSKGYTSQNGTKVPSILERLGFDQRHFEQLRAEARRAGKPDPFKDEEGWGFFAKHANSKLLDRYALDIQAVDGAQRYIGNIHEKFSSTLSYIWGSDENHLMANVNSKNVSDDRGFAKYVSNPMARTVNWINTKRSNWGGVNQIEDLINPLKTYISGMWKTELPDLNDLTNFSANKARLRSLLALQLMGMGAQSGDGWAPRIEYMEYDKYRTGIESGKISSENPNQPLGDRFVETKMSKQHMYDVWGKGIERKDKQGRTYLAVPGRGLSKKQVDELFHALNFIGIYTTEGAGDIHESNGHNPSHQYFTCNNSSYVPFAQQWWQNYRDIADSELSDYIPHEIHERANQMAAANTFSWNYLVTGGSALGRNIYKQYAEHRLSKKILIENLFKDAWWQNYAQDPVMFHKYLNTPVGMRFATPPDTHGNVQIINPYSYIENSKKILGVKMPYGLQWLAEALQAADATL